MVPFLEKPLAWLGAVGFFWFLLTGFWGPDGHWVALGLLVLFFGYWAAGNWRLLGSSSLAWLALVFVGYVVVRAVTGFWAAPATYHGQVTGALDLLGIGGVFVIFLLPWLIGPGRVRRLDWAFALVVVSLLIQVLLHLEADSFEAFMQHLPWFQMNPNAFGAIAGLLLLGTVAVGGRWLGQLDPDKPLGLRVGGWLVWPLMAGLLASGLIASQSRASWLATAVALPVVVGALLWRRFREGPGRWRPVVGAMAVLLAVGGGLIYSQWHLVENRVFAETQTIKNVLHWNFSDLPTDSVGQRIRLWRLGLQAIPEKPAFGWSPGGVEPMISERASPVYDHDYLHNMPLQVAAELGLIGFILFFGMVAISLREVFSATRRGRLPYELGVFWLGGLLYLAVEGMFDAPFHHDEFQFLLLFMGMIAMGAQLERLRQERRGGAGKGDRGHIVPLGREEAQDTPFTRTSLEA